MRWSAREAFAEWAPIRVRRCTLLASSSLAHPVFNLELDGVVLSSTVTERTVKGTRLLGRTREITRRRGGEGRGRLVGPKKCLLR